MDLGKLNAQQREAVENIVGPVLVLAGAGTGKTSVIVHRIAWMISKGINPENIVALTFTNKAAKEMRNRIIKFFPNKAFQDLYVGTFHAFGSMILRKYITRIGYAARFGIADDNDQTELIKQILEQLSLKDNNLPVEFYKNGIRHAKNYLQTLDDIRNSARMGWVDSLAKVYELYQKNLRMMNLVDFDDLIHLPLKILQDNPDLLTTKRNTFKYILVDEYQDTNFAQAELIRLLAEPLNNICVVGDDDQSIYGWRGAEVKNILGFSETFKGARIIRLEQNYRSTNVILTGANGLINKNSTRHGKSLWSKEEEGDLITIFEAKDETHEAKIVADAIQRYKYELNLPYRETVILLRSNFQSRIFEQTLQNCGIPYRLLGAKAFYERREIKDAMAYLKIAHNKNDDLSLLRILNVPPRGIGEKTIEKLKLYKEGTGKSYLDILKLSEFRALLSESASHRIHSFYESFSKGQKLFSQATNFPTAVKAYLEDIGYIGGLGKIYKEPAELEIRQESLIEFINSASILEDRLGQEITLEKFLEVNCLSEDYDRGQEKGQPVDEVTMMTVHLAKGMEYTNVVVVGMEQNSFPHERSVKENCLEEERRLFYVALTRAKKRIFLTRSKLRTKYNSKYIRYKSCFLSEIPVECIEYKTEKELLKPADSQQVETYMDALKAQFS